MLGINLKHSLATVAVAVGAVFYNGHAGLGTAAYQHNQTELAGVASPPQGFWLGSNDALQAVTDGTSNTLSIRAR